jgi:hypothetical protein
MTNEQMLFPALNGACIGVALYCVYRVVLNTIAEVKKIKRIGVDYAALNLATESNVCSGPHSWDTIQLAFKELPVEKYSVCKDCGYIAGTGHKLNGAGLEIFKNDLVRRAQRLEIQAQFDTKRERAYVEAGLSALDAVRLNAKLRDLNEEMAEILNKI